MLAHINSVLDSKSRSCRCDDDCLSTDDEQVSDLVSKGHFVMTRDSTNSVQLVSEILHHNDCDVEGNTTE